MADQDGFDAVVGGSGNDGEKAETPVRSPVPVSGLVALPAIPMPTASMKESGEVVDDNVNVAFKLAYVGLGQGGGRMAETFWKLGYRRVCCVNTNSQDLSGIDIPDANKLVLDIGEGGAGKDPEKGRSAADRYRDDIYDLMRRSFGREFDRIMVCVGSGGGTGSGMAVPTIEVAHEICKVLKVEKDSGPTSVGAIVSLPKLNEGQTVNANAHKVMEGLFDLVGPDRGKLAERTLSPLIVVDNERIQAMYPGLSVTQFWDTANASIAGLFHLFNSISCQNSDLTTFDRADFKDVLDSGIMTYGACPVSNYDTLTDISKAMRDNLQGSVLVGGFDLSQAKVGSCIFIGAPDVLDRIPQGHLEHGFDTMVRMMGSDGTLHRGIYKGDGEGLVVYSALAELGRPEDRMAEVAAVGKVNQ